MPAGPKVVPGSAAAAAADRLDGRKRCDRDPEGEIKSAE